MPRPYVRGHGRADPRPHVTYPADRPRRKPARGSGPQGRGRAQRRRHALAGRRVRLARRPVRHDDADGAAASTAKRTEHDRLERRHERHDDQRPPSAASTSATSSSTSSERRRPTPPRTRPRAGADRWSKLTWYVARASGIVAWALILTTIVWGLLLATQGARTPAVTGVAAQPPPVPGRAHGRLRRRARRRDPARQLHELRHHRRARPVHRFLAPGRGGVGHRRACTCWSRSRSPRSCATACRTARGTRCTCSATSSSPPRPCTCSRQEPT